MTGDASHQYRMTLSLNVLKHLGFGLYSNVPAVLAEVVANAWDADATHVDIKIDPQGRKITIRDDGHGMSVDNANDRYLHVGYERRNTAGGARTPKLKRPVMGRKGIGKLSLFSIARKVEVHSKRDGELHGFIMDAAKIEETIKKDDGEGQYHPEPVPFGEIRLDSDSGTEIILTGLKRKLHLTSAALRRRLARRFSIIGEQQSFQIELDGQRVTITDRGYHDKLQYIWTFGDRGEEVADVAHNLECRQERPPEIETGNGVLAIDGWIGTARKAGHLKDAESRENLNGIIVMVRGKLAQEDILEEFGEGGVYSKYVIGEIHADFLDQDDKEDIATTSRQRIIEDDPRYQALKSKLLSELKNVQSEWTDLRNQQGKNVATTIPQIKEWYGSLNPDHRKAAEKLFGRINQLPIDDATQKRQLFISSILAFESLRFRNLLHRIEQISVENLEALGDVFTQLDDLEASAYYQISKDRLEVITKLAGLVDEDAKEKALQKHLYKHLWLLDPSWERATHTALMETRVARALDEVYESLTDEQRKSRLDIRYATTGNKHVVIELKRASRRLNTGDLVTQIIKYRGAVVKVLSSQGKGDEPLEFICVIGTDLSDWSDLNGRQTSSDTLAGTDARVVMYDELIGNAQQAYQDYLDGQGQAGRVHELITSISVEDVEAMGEPAVATEPAA